MLWVVVCVVFPADREQEYVRNVRSSLVCAASLETVVLTVPGELLCPLQLSVFSSFLLALSPQVLDDR